MGKTEWFWIIVAGVAIYLAYRHGLNVGGALVKPAAVPAGLPATSTGPTAKLDSDLEQLMQDALSPTAGADVPG